jgi:transglutaminase-like putative cysteine protease
LGSAVRAAVGVVSGNFDVVLLGVASLVAVSPFGRVFSDVEYLLLSLGIVALTVAVALAVSRHRPLVFSMPLHLLVVMVYVMFAVFVALPTPSGLGEVVRGVSSSWDAMLSANLPAASQPELVVLPVLLSWLASVVATELAVRTSLVVSTLLPSGALLVVSLMFAGRRPVGFPWVALVYVLVILAVVLLRSNAESATHAHAAMGADGEVAASRMPLFVRLGVPVIVAVAAVSFVLAQVLPFTDDARRFELREGYEPPAEEFESVTPLAALWPALNPSEESPVVFTVTFPGDPDSVPDRIPVATLDAFDGSVWSTSAKFTRVGEGLPEPPGPLEQTGSELRQSYSITDEYDLVFLPAVGRPVELDPERDRELAVDRDSATVVSLEGRPREWKYEVVSAVPEIPETDREEAKWDADPVWSHLSAAPPSGSGQAAWPAEVTGFAAGVQPAATPYQFLGSLEDLMRSEAFGYDPQSNPGHGLGVLVGLLRAPGAPSSSEGEGAASTAPVRIGFAEQFATAFAAVARSKGLPARVVVGYRILDPEGAKKGEPVEVRENQLHAWAEVHLSGAGWVSFDPTNTEVREPQVPEAPTVIAQETPPPPPPPPGESQDEAGEEDECEEGEGRCTESDSGLPLWPFAVGGVVVLLPASVVTAKQVRRRRRRTRGSPAERVIGAWKETKDRLRSGGVATRSSMTVRELASSDGVERGSDLSSRLLVLAPVVDTALYACEDPSDEMVDLAWDAEAGVADVVREGSNLPQRVLTAVNPKPLFTRT